MSSKIKVMLKKAEVAAALCLLVASIATVAVAAPGEKYLHVKVDDQQNGESVNVNLPLSLAEKVLPTVSKGNLHAGIVTISDADIDGVDIKAILAAVRAAADNEFVTVKDKDSDVRVEKSNGNLVIHVRENDKEKSHRVDVTVPMKVVDALFSTAKKNELNVAAAIRALGEAGETILVSVEDASQHVKVWVDSRSTSE